MTKKERVLSAIHHKEPDKIPKGELAIAKETADAILGREYPERQREVRVREILGIDLLVVGSWGRAVPVRQDREGRTVYKNSYGYEYINTRHTRKIVKPITEVPEQVIHFQPPLLQEFDLDDVRYYAECTDLFLFAAVYGPESIVYDTLGFENYMQNVLLNGREIRILTEALVDFEIEKTKKMLDLGAEGVIIADDLAYNTGTFLSPELMENLVFPYFRQMIEEIKRYRDVPVFLHSDGNLNCILESIVGCGFDGLQSLQPSAGMDIGTIKNRFGGELCLMGNIDVDHLLPFGTEEQVRVNVLDTIRQAAPGGGYILSSCNVLTSAIPSVNTLAMYEAAEDYHNAGSDS